MLQQVAPKAGYAVVSSSSAAPLSSAHVIDRAHLSRFTFGDAALELEVLGLFTGQLPEIVSALKAASAGKTAAPDKDWHMAAHTLKGSARAVGAWQLAELAVQAEAPGVRQSDSDVSRLIRQIEAASEAVTRYVAGLTA